MAAFTVFYSWQSDLPRKTTRDFIHDSALKAIERLALDATLEDAPRLDHDTTGVSGIPAIGDTILGKIDLCGVFLADVSLVGTTTRNDKEKKALPNPNVLIELGYAAARMGWQRLILVMNAAYGLPDALPFDLRYRRHPFSFDLGEDRCDIERKSETLSNEIEMAVRMVMQTEHQVVTDLMKRLDGYTRHFLRKQSTSSQFWEKSIEENRITSKEDLALARLLELVIIECVPFTNDLGFAYTWTYFGRLCLSRLGFSVPQQGIAAIDFQNAQPLVMTDLSAYDDIDLRGSDDSSRNKQP